MLVSLLIQTRTQLRNKGTSETGAKTEFHAQPAASDLTLSLAEIKIKEALRATSKIRNNVRLILLFLCVL